MKRQRFRWIGAAYNQREHKPEHFKEELFQWRENAPGLV
jgi:hypothetical protein